MSGDISTGPGYAVGNIDAMGSGPGFRKVRRELEVTEFGVNAIVIPGGYQTGRHFHDRQQELYFVHRGALEFAFDDGTTHRVDEGGFARVDAATVRSIRNLGDDDAVYVCVGGEGGYVGRDAHQPAGETHR
jgi:quercetin dioxygenase-like cupin family protein